MATLYSYPLGTPLRSDLIIGSKIASPYNDNLPITQNYSIGSILDLVVGATGVQSLQQVTNVGQVGGVSISTNNVKFSGQFLDSAGTVGTNGQVLTSNATGNLIWSTDAGGTVTSVATTFSGDAVAIGGSPITAAGTLAYSWSGDATHYINGAGNKILLSTLPQGAVAGADTQIQYNNSGVFGAGSFLTTNKSSKVDIIYELGLVGDGTNQGLLKLYCEAGTPHYVGIKGPLHSGGASYTLQLPNTLPSVANQILESNASGALSWIATPTLTETDTLATVTARGATTAVASTFSGGLNSSGILTCNGTGANAYSYFTGNSATGTANEPPSNTFTHGLAQAWNNSGGSREWESFWATGADIEGDPAVPANGHAANASSYISGYNRYAGASTSGTPVDTRMYKWYGNGELEILDMATLPGGNARPTVSTPYITLPLSAGTNNSMLVRKSTKEVEFSASLSYNEALATLAILPASGTPSEIQMKSADNSIWKLAISNAGALVITGPF